MSCSLIERCFADSVQEFRASAKLRYDEGITLAQQEHYTAAIYLWGYAAEMILKAAYFDLTLSSPDKAISKTDLREAKKKACYLDVPNAKNANWHDLKMWAELIIRYRLTLPILEYRNSTFGNTLLCHSRQIFYHWQETLRYHSVIAEPSEVQQVQESVEWFIQNVLEI